MEMERESMSHKNCSLGSDLIDTNGTSNPEEKENRKSGEVIGMKLEIDNALF